MSFEYVYSLKLFGFFVWNKIIRLDNNYNIKKTILFNHYLIMQNQTTSLKKRKNISTVIFYKMLDREDQSIKVIKTIKT